MCGANRTALRNWKSPFPGTVNAVICVLAEVRGTCQYPFFKCCQVFRVPQFIKGGGNLGEGIRIVYPAEIDAETMLPVFLFHDDGGAPAGGWQFLVKIPSLSQCEQNFRSVHRHSNRVPPLLPLQQFSIVSRGGYGRDAGSRCLCRCRKSCIFFSYAAISSSNSSGSHTELREIAIWHCGFMFL